MSDINYQSSGYIGASFSANCNKLAGNVVETQCEYVRAIIASYILPSDNSSEYSCASFICLFCGIATAEHMCKWHVISRWLTSNIYIFYFIHYVCPDEYVSSSLLLLFLFVCLLLCCYINRPATFIMCWRPFHPNGIDNRQHSEETPYRKHKNSTVPLLSLFHRIA